ncbi:MAG: hypothetical protein K5848_05740 [Lachnospiraceae bacterium]|nr:hypothetical protein [Lachnospiraceae bacterium]
MEYKSPVRRYDSKIVNSRKSAEQLRLNRIRRIVIVIWLLVCIAGGTVFYEFYASHEYSDTPKVAISSGQGVTTGNPLTPGAKFGPYSGE